ncbi:caspase family protein [Rubrivivax rivuli]|nr:caspase family protein [Rubrivivax rivuli]
MNGVRLRHRAYSILFSACSLFGLILLPSWACAADHVLVLTISDYSHVKPLPGVRHDRENALELARLLGYDTRQARSLSNAELAGDGILRAVTALTGQVREGDRLFLYYSGHGASFPVVGGCAEALVPQDAGSALGVPGLVRTSDLIKALDGVRDKLSDAFVFFDACHAGGLRDLVASSGTSARSGLQQVGTPGLTGKSVPIRGGEHCLNVANRSSFKAFAPAGDSSARGMGLSLSRNFTFVAAAREDEEALDLENQGGLATTALLQCARDGVSNISGTGIVNVDELRRCAQQRINSLVPTITSAHRPHNVEVYSNVHKALANVRISAAPGSSSVSEAERVERVFEQVASNSNPNLGASAWFSRQRVALGQPVELHYSVRNPGFLSVLYVGSDRKDIQALLSNHPVRPSSTTLLGPTTITEPAGDNRFLVLYTREPVNWTAVLNDAKAGHKVALSAAISQSIACAAEGQRNATPFTLGSGPCGALRNATAFVPSKDVTPTNHSPFVGYGAWLLTVRGE